MNSWYGLQEIEDFLVSLYNDLNSGEKASKIVRNSKKRIAQELSQVLLQKEIFRKESESKTLVDIEED